MRSKDRLAELQRARERAGDDGGGDGDGGALLGRGAEGPSPAPRPDIESIFREVERIRGWIHELNGNTQLIRRLHADPTFHTNKHLQDQLDSVATQSNGVGLKVCGALRQMEGEMGVRVGVGAEGGGNAARGRILRLQYACSRRLYAEALAQHHTALQALQDAQRALLHEQIKLTNLTISDEECQNLLDSKNISLFVDNVRAETAEARRALRDVEARHEELARVEASLLQVRDLFTQLAYLVAAQGERVDSVEYYALQASEHVETGQQQLLKGTVSRTKARKKKISLIICLTAGFLVVLLVLVAT